MYENRLFPLPIIAETYGFKILKKKIGNIGPYSLLAGKFKRKFLKFSGKTQWYGIKALILKKTLKTLWI